MANDYLAPLLVVEEPGLGTAAFVAGSRPVGLDAGAGQPIQFRWRGDASAYGEEIEAYRYAWDLRDVGDDSQWDCGWSETCRQATPRHFENGVHRFYLQVRDSAGQVTSAAIEISVYPVTRRRDLLLVDDTSSYRAEDEIAEDRRWLAVLDSVRARHPFTFDPSWDVFDVAANRNDMPPRARLFDAKIVVWIVRKISSGCALADLGWFFDPFIERNRNSVQRFNYLFVYLDNGGQLWLSGDQPAHVVWPLSLVPDIDQQLPANITNWDDWLQPHPTVDSVGVASFLYRMGIEGVDLGGGGRAPRPRRDSLPHNCLGFRRATPPMFADQRTVSSLDDAPARLEVDVTWPLPFRDVNPLGGRVNIEIYDMPGFLASRLPPLAPPAWRVLPLYVYESAVHEDSARGVIYPLTADGQPAVLLARRAPEDPTYSRALCGFETWRLTFDSHRALAEYILVNQFGLGGGGRRATPDTGARSSSSPAALPAPSRSR